MKNNAQLTPKNAKQENVKSDWILLYKIGGVGASLIVAFTFIQMFVFFKWTPPNTVVEWFKLFQDNWIIGLLDMDLLLMVDYLLLVPLYLALYFLLRRANESLMALALITALLSVTIYFGSGGAFEMLSLSNKYASAATEAQRLVILASGETVLAQWQGTSFNISYILGALAALLFSIGMLKSRIFSKKTAYLGILMSLMMFIPPTIGTFGLILSILSLLPMMIWLVMIARKLFQLGGDAL